MTCQQKSYILMSVFEFGVSEAVNPKVYLQLRKTDIFDIVSDSGIQIDINGWKLTLCSKLPESHIYGGVCNHGLFADYFY